MAKQILVQSVLAISNAFLEGRETLYRKIKKATDTKIKTLVLQQIAQAIGRKSGALFPFALSPKVAIGFLSTLHVPKKSKQEPVQLVAVKSRPARSQERTIPLKRIPIGLKATEPHGWVNSLIQFLLFLPGTWELLSLIPRSFQPLRQFADQYAADQEENLSVSSADSAIWLRFFGRKLPYYFQRNPFLYDVLNAFMRTLFPHCPFATPREIHPVALHPEWHLITDSIDTLEKKWIECPPELLIGCKEASLPWKTHYFAASSSYDLDAFIELRPDGENRNHAIAYLKGDGVWYQCDDERVVRFRSNCLNAPLRRATLLHYKRTDLMQNKMYFKK